MSVVDTNDVAAHWHEHHTEDVGEANEHTLRENAVCFFNVAEAAGLGTMMLGRGGKPTRLELSQSVITSFVGDGRPTPPWTEDAGSSEVDEGEPPEDGTTDEQEMDADLTDDTSKPAIQTEPLRVFISHGSNHDIVEQIDVMLGLADIGSEIAIAEESTAIPVPEKVLNSMRKCQAGIIAVTVAPESSR